MSDQGPFKHRPTIGTYYVHEKRPGIVCPRIGQQTGFSSTLDVNEFSLFVAGAGIVVEADNTAQTGAKAYVRVSNDMHKGWTARRGRGCIHAGEFVDVPNGDADKKTCAVRLGGELFADLVPWNIPAARLRVGDRVLKGPASTMTVVRIDKSDTYRGRLAVTFDNGGEIWQAHCEPEQLMTIFAHALEIDAWDLQPGDLVNFGSPDDEVVSVNIPGTAIVPGNGLVHVHCRRDVYKTFGERESVRVLRRRFVADLVFETFAALQRRAPQPNPNKISSAVQRALTLTPSAQTLPTSDEQPALVHKAREFARRRTFAFDYTLETSEDAAPNDGIEIGGAPASHDMVKTMLTERMPEVHRMSDGSTRTVITGPETEPSYVVPFEPLAEPVDTSESHEDVATQRNKLTTDGPHYRPEDVQVSIGAQREDDPLTTRERVQIVREWLAALPQGEGAPFWLESAPVPVTLLRELLADYDRRGEANRESWQVRSRFVTAVRQALGDDFDGGDADVPEAVEQLRKRFDAAVIRGEQAEDKLVRIVRLVAPCVYSETIDPRCIQPLDIGRAANTEINAAFCRGMSQVAEVLGFRGEGSPVDYAKTWLHEYNEIENEVDRLEKREVALADECNDLERQVERLERELAERNEWINQELEQARDEVVSWRKRVDELHKRNNDLGIALKDRCGELERAIDQAASRSVDGRWEAAFRNIVTFMIGPREPFEINDVVERVRELAGCDANGDPIPGAGGPRDLSRARGLLNDWLDMYDLEDSAPAKMNLIADTNTWLRSRVPGLNHRALLSNLLARIHGDGGHHEAQVGTTQAVEDADAIIVRLRSEKPSAADLNPSARTSDELLAELPDVEHMRSVAHEAPAGPWRVQETRFGLGVSTAEGKHLSVSPCVAEYMSTFDPRTVLHVLALIGALQKENDELLMSLQASLEREVKLGEQLSRALLLRNTARAFANRRTKERDQAEHERDAAARKLVQVLAAHDDRRDALATVDQYLRSLTLSVRTTQLDARVRELIEGFHGVEHVDVTEDRDANTITARVIGDVEQGKLVEHLHERLPMITTRRLQVEVVNPHALTPEQLAAEYERINPGWKVSVQPDGSLIATSVNERTFADASICYPPKPPRGEHFGVYNDDELVHGLDADTQRRNFWTWLKGPAFDCYTEDQIAKATRLVSQAAARGYPVPQIQKGSEREMSLTWPMQSEPTGVLSADVFDDGRIEWWCYVEHNDRTIKLAEGYGDRYDPPKGSSDEANVWSDYMKAQRENDTALVEALRWRYAAAHVASCMTGVGSAC